MGNPAGVRKKKREKRRLKFEQRLGGVLAYVPKQIREEIMSSIQEEMANAKKAAESAKPAAE